MKYLMGFAFGLIIWSANGLASATTWAANGHEYQLVSQQQTIYTWEDADFYRSEFLGIDWHLATITSQEEQDWLVENILSGNSGEYWIGGLEYPPINPENSWLWVTEEVWDFTAWGNGEPNDKINIANYQYAACNSNGYWFVGGIRNIDGFIAEKDSAPVPEPASMLLFGIGIIGFVGTKLRRKK